MHLKSVLRIGVLHATLLVGCRHHTCVLGAGTANAVACADDAHVVARAAREVRQPNVDFVWAQLRELADVFERRCGQILI